MEDSPVLFLALFQLILISCCFYLCIKSCAIINCCKLLPNVFIKFFFINILIILVNGFWNFFGKHKNEEEAQGLSIPYSTNQSYFMPIIEHPVLPSDCRLTNCNSPVCHHNFVNEKRTVETNDVAINISGQALLESEL